MAVLHFPGFQHFWSLLKALLDLKAPLESPRLTGIPTAPTQEPHDNSTKVATTEYVDSAVAELVSSSPAALDTLKELSDAIGGDANFSTTMTNALALKAPLASPALTGSPTAPTQNAGDNSTKIATTAYADRNDAACVHLAGAETVSGAKTFTAYPVLHGTGPVFGLSASEYVKGTNPATQRWGGVHFIDKTKDTAATKRAGSLEFTVATNGQTEAWLRAYNWVSGSSAKGDLGIIYPKDGTPYTQAPTPAAGDNSTKIATTAFVTTAVANEDATCVHTTGNETIAGTKTFSSAISGSITGNAATATKTTATIAVDKTGELVHAQMGTNDLFRIAVGGGSNAGWAEIATGDDYSEPIYVRQYQGSFATLKRTATLLDGSGNTSFPGTVTANSFSGPLVGNVTGNCSGSSGSCTGNAKTATTLATARDINISDSDGTNTGTKISFNGSANGTIKLPATIKASITGNCSGNAGTATKLATARSISAEELEFQGSANFDGSGNIKLNVTHHRSIVTVGNRNNYPFHRIAYISTLSGNYIDRGITFIISKDYDGGGWGICRIILRTNNTGNSDVANCTVQWLIRSSEISADAIQVGFCNTSNASYIDVFYKSAGSYNSAICRVLAHSNARNSVGRGFTIIATSTEANNTTASDALTSVESYATIAAAGTKLHNKAYTSTVTASDVGVANSSNSCTGNAATATTLHTTRTINGTNFNGSANITTANWGTARNIYIADSDATNTGAAVSVNGSGNATLKLPATIKASITGNCSGSSGSCTGNAKTATTLATARDINISDADGTNTGTKISFNGSANGTIKLPATIKASITGNCSGSSGSCTGNAATATKLATARSLWGNNFDGSTAITGTISGLPCIEFKPTANNSNNGGYLDFHYNQSTADYTSRIIESASGTLNINNVTITTGKVVTATTFNGALTGNVTGNCSGSSGSCTGNAKTATTLATARDINISDADGTNTGTKISFNGSANGTIKLPATIKASITGNCSGSSRSCTGNAKTATTLQTARKINGVSFNGSADITVADSTKVAKTGDTMTGALSLKTNGGNAIRFYDTGATKGTAPSADRYHYIEFFDKDGKRMGWLGSSYFKDKGTRMVLSARKSNAAGDTAEEGIGVHVDANGTAYGWAPTPPAGDNTTTIATTAWVRARLSNSEFGMVPSNNPGDNDASPGNNGTTYTAPTNGFLKVEHNNGGNYDCWVYVNGHGTCMHSGGYGSGGQHSGGACFFPVRKGWKFKVTGSNWFAFQRC